MSEPRRSTRARAREEAAPIPETPTPKDRPAKSAKSTLKRKRSSAVATPATPTAEATPHAPQHTLPLRITDGQPLPTLPSPQPLELPAAEWQDIQQSGVLSASLQQSRAVWVSGVNFRTFHEFFTQPKKVPERTDEDKARQQRQKELQKNFPQVGPEAQLVIEPHTFNIRLYGPREVPRTLPKKTPSYGAWPNHSQNTQYTQPHPHQQSHPHPHQYGQPAYQKPQPQPRPPPPKPVAVPQTPTPATSTPAPDPVIHMLAARAGTDPELKAVMKIVAAGQATKEQLEFFQIHIQELTDIVAGQKGAAKSKVEAPPAKVSAAPPQQKPVATPVQAKPAPTHVVAAPPRPVQPAQHPQQQQQHQPQQPQKPYAPPLQQHPYNPTPYTQPPPQYHHPTPQYNTPPPPRTTYRPLVFSFTEGNQDMFYLPSYSILEWLPNGSGAKLSFLITKMKDDIAPPTAIPTPTPTPITPTPTAPLNPPTTPSLPPQQQPPFTPPPRIESFDDQTLIPHISLYQPVTVLLLTDSFDIKNALARAVRPHDVVERYMEEVFQRCRRAGETYLAFRLPREEGVREVEGDGGVGGVLGTVGEGGVMGGGGEKKKAGRPRRSGGAF
ncbi:hypothetical protein P153DRAFT_415851 [Dothidotthia symphoricarpi CBS 119687]|uniref:SWR1-complex protein 3 domain-containing protein n=1 Tax=Dothidotthia symphoricarpi CBS 119687 TaxID=1392245 RepID=A0A6A6AP92_9PLEO|nr:uncharacterized protein P153DRAFT_415851 [Dothidotthia symphoricarpi CBS 119687]KAF2132321.1 hypothetical protein P153DRAFT_415851 [Dothidotthia symphoricarpi CBS 119687]